MEILFHNLNFIQQYLINFKNSLVVFEMHPPRLTQPMKIKEIKVDIEKLVENQFRSSWHLKNN